MAWVLSWASVAVAASPGGAADNASDAARVAPDAASLASNAASKRALAEGLAALAAVPPDRASARAAFERASDNAGDPATVAQANFRLGVLDEEDAAPKRALEHYRACIEAASTSRLARTARSRIEWLEQRAEGNFAPLAALLRQRRDPALLRDPAAIESLAAQAETFPPGLVRCEARMQVAEAWLKLPAERARAITELGRVVADPSSGSKNAVLAERDLVAALLADEQLAAAASEVELHPFEPSVVTEVHRLVRRRWLRRAAYCELVLALSLALALSARALSARARNRRSATAERPTQPSHRRRWRPSILITTLFVAALSVAAAGFLTADAVHSKQLRYWGV